jgi:hypothetical protein
MALSIMNEVCNVAEGHALHVRGKLAITAILAMLSLASCAMRTDQPAQDDSSSDTETTGRSRVVAEGYHIGPEDVLQISVWKEEELNREVVVRPDGGISFPQSPGGRGRDHQADPKIRACILDA